MFYMNKFEYSKDKSIQSDGLKICKLKKNDSIKIIQKAVKKIFNSKENLENSKTFRKKLLQVQDLINKKEVHIQIINENKKFFCDLFKVKKLSDLSVQSVVYFRGVRPNQKQKSEYVLGGTYSHQKNFFLGFSFPIFVTHFPFKLISLV